MTLYEIEADILTCVDPETGEIIDPAKLDALQMEREKKIENVALWVKDLRAEADAIGSEIKSLSARKRAAEGKIERLRAWLLDALDGELFKTSKVRICYTRNSRLKIDDEGEMVSYLLNHPEYSAFLRFTEPEINKDVMKQALKDGMEIPGASIEPTESVVIK